MLLCVDQLHMQAADLIGEPLLFLELIERHCVSRSFAPNFFLARLLQEINLNRDLEKSFDLSSLVLIATGGEANPVNTCASLSKALVSFGAPVDVITPGFGMTETCAGAIYNAKCPDYDEQQKLEFASLGHCLPGIHMRITCPDGTMERLASPNEVGNLEVSGQVVFQEYFNDKSNTRNAFTLDGWFRTGDRAFIDSEGFLNLAGRGKEQMNINGVKYAPHEVETAIEEACIIGITSTYTVCFSYRTASSQTEQICVVYLPSYQPSDSEESIQAQDAISKVVMLLTNVRPYVLPLDSSRLQKSTLGKLSRAKIHSAFKAGEYREYQALKDEALRSYRQAHAEPPQNQTEELLLQEFEEALNLSRDELGTNTHLLDAGITSIELIKVTRGIEKRLKLPYQIPISTVITHPTVQRLAKALEQLHTPKSFDPVVTLQHQGSETPLWLVHPGVGEVLVFLPLAKYFLNRPLHTLRARGFNAGEEYFSSITEAVTIYHNAIKRVQPTGPYAIAGYSYGSMLAFEIAKILERNGDEVAFLGSFNLPPHIKSRMRQLNWTECLLNLAYFLELITEEHAQQISSDLKLVPPKDRTRSSTLSSHPPPPCDCQN